MINFLDILLKKQLQLILFRNGSVLADIAIVYAQNVGPQQFAVIYQALYEEGVLGNLSVQPISDNGTGCFNFMIYIALYIPPVIVYPLLIIIGMAKAGLATDNFNVARSEFLLARK